MADRPNIILICADQWRADCLSIAGHPAVETPHLDELANGGVRFTRAFSAVPSCIAARAALLTGLSQRKHGRVGYADGVTWNYPVTLEGELARAGYQTCAVGKMHVHPQRNPMGFERVILHDGRVHYYRKDLQSDYVDWLGRALGPDRGLFDHGLDCNSWVARPWHLEEWTHPTYWATSRAVEFLRTRDASRPFFLFLSYVAPHAPLVPPAWYLDQYDRQDLPAPPVGDWVGKLKLDFERDRWNVSSHCGRLDPRAQHRAQAGYYGLITQIDHQIGRLVEHCSDFGVRDNTVFLFVSDHGELLGDHHLFRKSVPYAGSAGVPLLMRFPAGMRSGGLGGLCDSPVELRDIMPTLLESAGAPVPASVEGRSLLPLVRGDRAGWRTHLHGEHTGLMSNHYVVDGRFKYIWYSQSGLEQLFDNQADPRELHDLIDEPSRRADIERLRDALVAELTGREEGYVHAGRLVVGRKPLSVLAHVRA